MSYSCFTAAGLGIRGRPQGQERFGSGPGEAEPTVQPGQAEQLPGLRPVADHLQAGAVNVGPMSSADQRAESGGVEFVAYRQNWGEDRVHLHDENGELFSVPAGWTDVAPVDPFAVIADGRCPFTVDGLLALADLIGRLRSFPAADAAVKKIMP